MTCRIKHEAHVRQNCPMRRKIPRKGGSSDLPQYYSSGPCLQCIIMLKLFVLPLVENDRQPNCCATNIWHDNLMTHRQSEVLARRNLLYSAIVPTDHMTVQMVLMHVCLALSQVSFFSFLLLFEICLIRTGNSVGTQVVLHELQEKEEFPGW